MKEKIISIIYQIIDDSNELLEEGKKISKSENANLFGNDGPLDSLGIVNFIVSLEQKIEKETGKNIILSNEANLSQQESPFSTVSSLLEYLLKEVKTESEKI